MQLLTVFLASLPNVTPSNETVFFPSTMILLAKVGGTSPNYMGWHTSRRQLSNVFHVVGLRKVIRLFYRGLR